MVQRQWFGMLLAFLLGAAGIILLVIVSLPDAPLRFPESTGVIALILTLFLAVFAAIYVLVRELLRRAWQSGGDQTRLKAMGEHQRFLSRLDHELKNPLTALRAGLASLALTLREDDQRQIVQTLADEAQRLSRLVTDLRKLAELDVVTLDLQTMPVSELCRDVSALVEERCISIDRRVEMECLPEFERQPMLVGDADLLLLAVHNLLDNAIKYTQNGERITVGFGFDAAEMVVSVADTGIGIAEHEQSLVWEELYRGKNAKGTPGSGIGLALVKAIVERHNGRVELQSTLGAGTKVSLYLPLL